MLKHLLMFGMTPIPEKVQKTPKNGLSDSDEVWQLILARIMVFEL